MLNNWFPASFVRFGWCPSVEWVCNVPAAGASSRTGQLQGSPGFPCLSHRSMVSHRTTKIFSLQAIIFKPVFLNTKCLSLSLKQQPRNEGNEGAFPQVLLRYFLGRTGQEFVRSAWKAFEGLLTDLVWIPFPTLSQGSLPPATNPIFACVWPFWGR